MTCTISYSEICAARRVSDWRPEPPTPTSNAWLLGCFKIRHIRDKCSTANLKFQKKKKKKYENRKKNKRKSFLKIFTWIKLDSLVFCSYCWILEDILHRYLLENEYPEFPYSDVVLLSDSQSHNKSVFEVHIHLSIQNLTLI